MPYCFKCGVEIDYDINKCPLCDFPIPKIEVEEKEDINRYPSPQNMYPKKAKKRKQKIFIILSVALLSLMGLLLFLNISALGKWTWSKYSTVSIFATLIYLFFLFGFVPKFKTSLIGISMNTIILLYFLDLFDGKLEWFRLIGLPCVFMGTLETIIIAHLFKRTKKKGSNIVAYILLAISVYCIGVEGFISLHTREVIKLYWSMIVSIVLFPLALLLLYLHYGLPEKYKVKLKRKFHI